MGREVSGANRLLIKVYIVMPIYKIPTMIKFILPRKDNRFTTATISPRHEADTWFTIVEEGLELSPLIHAHNVLLFGKFDLQQPQCLKSVLEEYNKGSG